MTEKGGNRGRGRNIVKYIPYSNFPSTGGRELKGGGIIKTERKGFNPFLSFYTG